MVSSRGSAKLQRDRDLADFVDLHLVDELRGV